MPRNAFIVYDGLPVSSGGAHRLRERDPVRAWEQLTRFLDHCCKSLSFRCRLLLYETFPPNVPVRGLAKLQPKVRRPDGPTADVRTEATPLFGKPQRRKMMQLDGKETFEEEWVVDRDLIPAALQLLAAHPIPDPEALPNFPALVLGIGTHFFIKDPQTGRVVPGQRFEGCEKFEGPMYGIPLGESQAYVRLSSHTACSLILTLPLVVPRDVV